MRFWLFRKKESIGQQVGDSASIEGAWRGAVDCTGMDRSIFTLFWVIAPLMAKFFGCFLPARGALWGGIVGGSSMNAERCPWRCRCFGGMLGLVMCGTGARIFTNLHLMAVWGAVGPGPDTCTCVLLMYYTDIGMEIKGFFERVHPSESCANATCCGGTSFRETAATREMASYFAG